MKRKIIALSLTLLLCAASAGPAFAVETNVAPGGGGSLNLDEMWSISDVVSTGTVKWDEARGVYIAVNEAGDYDKVYFTNAPATAVLVSTELGDTSKDRYCSVAVRKVSYENGELAPIPGAEPIKPASGNLESYLDEDYDPPAAMWRYSVGSTLTLKKGAYEFTFEGARGDMFYVVAGESVPDPEKPAVLTAVPTASTVLVNGENVSFDAYNISGNNYFKLRDLAYALNGTEKQFDVGWDGNNNRVTLTDGRPYTAVGGEMASKGAGDKTPTPTSSDLSFNFADYDGPIPNFGFIAYNIEGNNYFKLRDIAYAFDFGVDWDGARNTIVIDTGKGYTPE
jgi:hypothetical protein